MPSPLVATTLKAAALAALSNILAQLIQSDGATTLDLTAVVRFAVFSIITTPLNIKWQEYLEDKFPGTEIRADGTPRTKKVNTGKKVVLDQALGAVVNSAAFITFFAVAAGKDGVGAWEAVQRDIIGLVVAGWKLWPAVSLLNFAVVPLDKRILVNSIVGLFWGGLFVDTYERIGFHGRWNYDDRRLMTNDQLERVRSRDLRSWIPAATDRENLCAY